MLLAFDETHTQVFGPGGLTKLWGLEPDIVTAGKSIAAGVPFGAWGSDRRDRRGAGSQGPGRRAGTRGRHRRHDLRQPPVDGGGAGHACSRSSPTRPMPTRRPWARGSPAGMRDAVARAGLPWYIHHLGPRAGYTFAPAPPGPPREARAVHDDLLTRLIRIWLANRGVWEAIVGAGPVVPCSGRPTSDVDAYVDALDALLDELHPLVEELAAAHLGPVPQHALVDLGGLRVPRVARARRAPPGRRSRCGRRPARPRSAGRRARRSRARRARADRRRAIHWCRSTSSSPIEPSSERRSTGIASSARRIARRVGVR